ncbi:hypothetical protein B9T31_09145 [Acinetobacter sp. ANC 4558]|uniref:hypothetical protein n=1 Tax=Acinetobacter sp. ANC 4558 TaxID=1977876 RepID=UPI000A3463F9|nr:hypothetical protein [Acinetobacter sp. ANC 4558]OTG86191.1 hypothetical protein B9T31_09145 [Acinetobacter sp. ANC 4558]
MKLKHILLTAILATAATITVAAPETHPTTPAAPTVAIPTNEQEAEAATVKGATSEVAVEEELKDKNTAQ